MQVAGTKKAVLEAGTEPRMHFNQGSYNTFFNVKATPEPEDHK
jgi:hypothetical protein